ncbi:contractile injection system tape measure protein [Flavobacterium pectinovorum]|uniref:Uncharacterized protein n=1 Tax=Flavobacterium pectinovorum TaxID=29533 RepID=A0A502F7E6_9FLAO|nr:contractile injection system tape measure protein [Flavobacterium pectinovorum]TPG45284.1 hypothetical protein EAH81_01405 [Flavobacterium pectinovorum]
MQTANRHIINKLFFEVNTASKKNAYDLKDNLDTFLKVELFPLLETYFDTLDKKMPSHSIQIEKLNMDLSVSDDIDFSNLKLEIMNQFQNQIEKQIESGFTDTKQYTFVNNREKSLNEFFSFLETGTNPWWAISKDVLDNNTDNPFEKMISDKAFGLKLIHTLENRQTRTRFIKQLSDDQIYFILKNTFLLELPSEETTLKSITLIKDTLKALLSESRQELHQRNLVWDIILSQLLKHNDSIIKDKLSYLIASFDIIRKYNPTFALEYINIQITNKSALDILSNLANEVLIIHTILEQKASEIIQNNNNHQNKSSESDISKTDKSLALSPKKEAEINAVFKTEEETEEEEILKPSLFLIDEITAEIPANHYVNNAGLILIHPFLKQLFTNCKLLNKDNSINNTEVAAHLLHYLATAKEQDYEHEMVFEKLLCNIPIDQTINRNITLSDEVKSHANEMLRAVLDHWEVMKKSSVALLQNEYLQRPGKIILTGDNPKVIVERKTQDILLDKISWNIGIVKLAWKNKVIFVDW